MSLASWKAEFLRKSAESAAEGTVGEVILHSLGKWKGLTTENLSKHQITKSKTTSRLDGVAGEAPEWIADNTCSLCVAAKTATGVAVGPEMSAPELELLGLWDQHCQNCLLTRYGERFGCMPAYVQFVQASDPQPMISLLGKALTEATESGDSGTLAKDAV